MQDKLIIKGARVHNLKNVSLEIPKNKLVVITGLSGSGKSSLAFDTIYAEGQRRYAESLSSYARQFMEVRDKPDVDSIEGLSPTIAIDQKSYTQNPRSTVGTVTEIYDYMRLLFARTGQQYCPDCQEPVRAYTQGGILEEVRRRARKSGKLLLLSPLIRNAKVVRADLVEKVEKSGYESVRVNGEVMKINSLAKYEFSENKLYNVELLIGEIEDFQKQDLMKMVESALDLSDGLLILAETSKNSGKDETFSTSGLCHKCGKIMPILDMRSFSFNSPYGACPRCTGLGITQEVDPELVIPNDRLTLAEGAVQPWMRITGNQSWYQKIIAAVAASHGFSINTPVKDLGPKIKNIILQGTGEQEYMVDGKKTKFTGVVPNLLQRHLETDSEYVRREIEQYMHETVCPLCSGKRLHRNSLAVKIGEFNIADLCALNIEDNIEFFKKINTKLVASGNLGGLSDTQKAAIAKPILKEIVQRLESLSKVGLSYLAIDRSMNTLSGGEVTRTRLATQLSTGLIGVIYILDEPSIGLHPKDNKMLIESLRSLRDLGNSVIVVEHDSAMMEAADYIIDVGPGAGVGGGQIIAQGTVAQIKKTKKSLTGEYLSGRSKISCEPEKGQDKSKKPSGKSIKVIGAKAFNLQNVDVEIPLGKLVCVTGVSGSGKSTLVIDILGKALSKHFYRAKEEPAAHKEIKGIDNIDKVIAIDQSPIGRTPRSSPATYTGVFTLIRDLFADLPEARMNNYDAGKFSFNVKGGGRCEACAGDGYARIPMQFLADVYVQCSECDGARYNREALEIHYRSKNIADVLNMTVDEARMFFGDIPNISDKLNILREVGLGYMHLGQPATKLSGGEAQRVKLATELSRSSTGKTLYILDEPTTGLHFEDIRHLLQVLNRLVAKGNTVLIIEHNLEIIGCSDWIIDMGPGGGRHGGQVVAQGTAADLMKNKNSWTGKYLKTLP
ncbi:MAG: excinuclease ABC subunit A [Candidatus Magasanikbacteria bacterium RIFOXYD1_FULL_40_23]|uniref:UvrABC system protein A n=1 Tax=Candidatus Magasanikbacteria bacterium RIFOXYD1_FULL_40_23 TaxID=1798705 RepID=A0A1F6P7Z6_9BACT|nr:MAG: excinuclease ABC subunit A [Candidatus Magasanikbacteria bacterium RIFOXYD1_FULL_40_23]